MKKARFTESQVVAVLKEGEAGVAPAEHARRYGISRATCFTWRSKYGGVTANELKRMKWREGIGVVRSDWLGHAEMFAEARLT